MGTAQLGMDYGVSNTQGKVREKTAWALIDKALEFGVYRFDTASHYGCSEVVLGRALRELDKTGKSRVTSKLDPAIVPSDEKRVLHAVNASADRLGRPLDAFLLHDETTLDRWTDDIDILLQEIVDKGLAYRVGISVYSPRYALMALEKPSLSVLQIPGNVLDNRFTSSGVVEKAVDRNVRLMVRSVFLQGLLLIDPEAIPRRLAYARPYVARFHAIAKEHSLSPVVAAMAYVRRAFPGTLILFGALDTDQLRENLQSFENYITDAEYAFFRDQLTDAPENLLNPSLWPTKSNPNPSSRSNG